MTTGQACSRARSRALRPSAARRGPSADRSRIAAASAPTSKGGTATPQPEPIHASRSRSKWTTALPWERASSAVRQNVS
ncbi:MAG: hypothetical protein BGP03_02425 [Pseudonocardia sp. 73-21]|nr:MAG: hypothetical protein BGP03_02425 [Pseudonocardia sp. 73-21]